MKLLDVEWLGEDCEAILSVEWEPIAGRISKLFGYDTKRKCYAKYRGEETTWRDAETGVRCSTGTEVLLGALWNKAKWGRK